MLLNDNCGTGQDIYATHNNTVDALFYDKGFTIENRGANNSVYNNYATDPNNVYPDAQTIIANAGSFLSQDLNNFPVRINTHSDKMVQAPSARVRICTSDGKLRITIDNMPKDGAMIRMYKPNGTLVREIKSSISRTGISLHCQTAFMCIHSLSIKK